MVEDEQTSSKVEWNMAALLNMELAKLRQEANSNYIAGRYKRAVDSLKTMKMTAVHVMTSQERDKLKVIEKKLEIPLLAYSGLGSFNPNERIKANEAALYVRDQFSIYNELLMDILNEHGFLGSYKMDAGKMKV